MNDPTGTYTFAYDNMGRLLGTSTQYAFLPGATYANTYTYDKASNRTGFTDPQSATTTYVYDTLNRLSTLGNLSVGSFTFSYDALSRRTQMTRPNGVNTNYTYDSLSRLLTILHQVGTTTIDGATYTYDNVGNRLSKLNHLNAVTDSYGYDNIYQLLSVVQGATTTESYTYDKVGNRLSDVSGATYTVNNSNQLTSQNGITYSYDNNGNTLTKVDGSGTTTYTWNSQNQLTQVNLPGGSTVSFKYDPFGRRIQKSSVSETANYLYDGPDLLKEVDNSGTVLAGYTFSGKIDQPLSMLRPGVTSYYEQDGIGSVSAISNSAGVLANTYSYDSFGNLTSSTGTLTNHFRYTGREFDTESGIYYYRARFYDLASGRFISEDPARFDQGGNFYVYVGNTPTLFIDPTGLAKCCPSGNADRIQKDADNARQRLWALRNTGTAVLPTDTSANVGAMTGCLYGGVVKGTNIRVPNQYIIDIRIDPKKDPCGYECAVVHERVHAKQCMTLGAGFFSMTEAQKEIPAYMMELGCLLKMQYDNGLGPYHK